MNNIINDKNGISYKLNQSDSTAIVVGLTNSISSLLIPKFIKHNNHEYPIIAIGENSFKKNRRLKTIKFPKDSQIRSIEKEAFAYSSLTNIKIPPTANHIGERAFSFCRHLVSVDFSDNSNLHSIGKFNKHFNSSKSRRISN
ncbi:hypothetical protein M9Y10_024441 [Tritrichomonas musculus]|uniref:Leucine rich repeat protein n=1 Tax=Tritrichomonas musculus TaxID=1915356 RepID=A0ABR2HBY1_9EUKA